MKIAFQGEKGAFSERAAWEFFSNKKISPLPCREFAGIFSSVESGKASAGMVPIENSNAGSIFQNYDLLLDSKVSIVGEIKLRIKHNLLALPGAKLNEIERIYSHPQALLQCSNFLGKQSADQIAFYDTAGAAKWVSEQADPTGAAIAGELAAETYGLKLLKRGIENNSQNYTRFVVIKKQPTKVKKDTPKVKTSIVFALKNIPGGLHKALSVFAIRDIDLLKLQSRPIPGSPWKYYFYLDFAGSIYDEAGGRAVDHLSEITMVCKVLGSYPSCS